MSFQRYVVTKEEKALLDHFYKVVKQNPQVHDAVRVEFKGLISQLDVEIQPFQLSRLLTKPSDSKYEFILLLYHYTLETLRFELKYMETKFLDRKQFDLAQKELSALVAYTKRGDANKIQGDTGPRETIHIDHPPQFDDYMEEVPASFYGEYFGYRWSSSGELLRFYVKISPYPGDLRRTYFHNEYVRGNDTWVIDGSGIYTKRVLYLYGYAESEDKRTHFGLRLSALRPLTENGEILCGLLISMNFDEPIAARILFIPLSKHKKSSEDAKLSSRGYIDKMIGKNDQTPFNLDHLDDEILRPISQVLQDVRRFDGNRLEPKVFFQLIRNSTPNVLRMKPDWSSKDKFCLEQALADTELELRKLERQEEFKGKPQEGLWLKAFQKFIKDNKNEND